MIQHKNIASEIKFQDSGSKSFLAAVNLHQTAVIFFSFSKNFFFWQKTRPGDGWIGKIPQPVLNGFHSLATFPVGSFSTPF